MYFALEFSRKLLKSLAVITQFFSFKIDSELKHTFKAGQWVDFFIPGMDKIGGFSMSSHPSLLTEKQVLNHSLQHLLKLVKSYAKF